MGSPDADLPPESLSKQIDFILEIDRLKSVVRRASLLDRSRRENTAEHSWQIALESSEARFAKAMDRLQPLLNNYFTQGSTWKEVGVTQEQVIAINQPIAIASPQLWAHAQELIEDAVRQGFLRPANTDSR